MNTDRIEKKIPLSASRKRVWGAVSDSTEFGTWFDVKFDGPFVPEAKVRGVIVPTRVNDEVAKAQQEYDGLSFEIAIRSASGCSRSGGIPMLLSAKLATLLSRRRWLYLPRSMWGRASCRPLRSPASIKSLLRVVTDSLSSENVSLR
jgi:hypothetical protein